MVNEKADDANKGLGAGSSGNIFEMSADEQLKIAQKHQKTLQDQQKAQFTGGFSPDQHAEILKRTFSQLSQPNTFKPGDLICHKPGCKDTSMPYDGYPAIVKDVLKKPLVFTGCDVCNTYYNRHFDLVIYMVHNGMLLPFVAQSERWMPFVTTENPQ